MNNTPSFVLRLGFVAAWLVAGAPARAQDHRDGEPAASVEPASVSAAAGMFLPTLIAPRVDSQTAFMRTLGGYDSARRSAQFEAIGDVTIIGPLAARVGALYSQRPNSLRPLFGLRVQALSQEAHAIDMAVGGFYRPEGFTEAEGEVELAVMIGRRFGPLAMFANLVYGQDPEGAERDAEAKIAALYQVIAALQAGFDARLRFDLGSEEGKRRTEGGAEYDLVVGPTASLAFGHLAALAQTGLSVFGTKAARLGAVALIGVAGSL